MWGSELSRLISVPGVGSVSDKQGKNAQLAAWYCAALDSGTRVSLHGRLFRICYLLDEIIKILDDQVVQIQTLSLQRTDLKGTMKWVLGTPEFIFVSVQLVYMCFFKTTYEMSYETLEDALYMLRTCLASLSIFIPSKMENYYLICHDSPYSLFSFNEKQLSHFKKDLLFTGLQFVSFQGLERDCVLWSLVWLFCFSRRLGSSNWNPESTEADGKFLGPKFLGTKVFVFISDLYDMLLIKNLGWLQWVGKHSQWKLW